MERTDYEEAVIRDWWDQIADRSLLAWRELSNARSMLHRKADAEGPDSPAGRAYAALTVAMRAALQADTDVRAAYAEDLWAPEEAA